MIKNVKFAELNKKIALAFLNTQNLKRIQKNRNVICSNKNYQEKFNEKLKKWFLNT